MKEHVDFIGKSWKDILDHFRGEVPKDALKGADLTRADLSGADLSGVDFTEANLIRANLRWADLSNANLIGADLRWADLIDADLINANLIGADLRWADLRLADLIGAKLSEADLRWADLRWADLSGAYLDNTNLNGTIYKPNNDIPNNSMVQFNRNVVDEKTYQSYCKKGVVGKYFIYLGKIPNLKEACIVAELATGKILGPFRSNEFKPYEPQED